MPVFVSGSDESAGKTQRDTFLYGGWVGPEDDWLRLFTPAWRERVLDGPPPIPYLHMTEIRSTSWRREYGISKSEADHRIDEAFAVIAGTPTLYPLGIYLDAGHLRDKFSTTKVVSSTGGKKPFEPDYLCFLGYVYGVLSYVAEFHPEAEKVDFIVERKGVVTKYVQEFHAHLAQALGALQKPALANLVGKLIPGGKDRVPLQVADVLCWHSARDKGAMDHDDKRRYALIAHRQGTRYHLNNEQISEIEASLLLP